VISNVANLTPYRDQLNELLDDMLCLKERILSGTKKEMTGLSAGNIAVLSNVLQRMDAHQFKKTFLLRAIHW